MALQTFGWMLHGNFEAPADGDNYKISVNWVMPTGTVKEHEESMSGQQVIDSVGELMCPWEMNIIGWVPIHDKTVYDSMGVAAAHPVDLHDIQKKIKKEITDKCRDCLLPFSPDIEQLEAKRGEISLPHLFAPLTLLPAGISRDVLGLCQSIIVKCETSPDACAPVISRVRGDDTLIYRPDTCGPVNQHRIIKYKTYRQADVGKEEELQGEPELQILMNKLEALPSAELTASLQTAERAEVGARAWLADAFLAPLPVLAQVLSNDKDKVWSIKLNKYSLLNRTLGPGYLRTEINAITGEKQHFWFWDRLQSGGVIDIDIDSWDGNHTVWDTLSSEVKQSDGEVRRWLHSLVEKEDTIDDFAITAGRILGDAEGRRVFMMAWLAAVACSYYKKPDKEPQRGFNDWYTLLMPHYADNSIAEIQSRWWIYYLAEKGGAADPTKDLKATVEKWIAGDLSDSPESLSKNFQPALALLVGITPPPTQTDVINRLCASLHQCLQLPGTQQVVSLAEERDLAVEIRFADPVSDTNFRGFAIAMGMGKKTVNAAFGCAWLTDTAVKILPDKQWIQDGKDIRRFHDTVGATKQNGRRVVAFPYSGKPLSGAVDITDGVDCLDFGWPEEEKPEDHKVKIPLWPTPPLAYGFRYWVAGTAIGNGGQIINLDYQDGDPCKLIAAKNIKFTEDGFLYLCRVAPGAVTIQPVKETINPYAMESESRGWHRPLNKDGRRSRVAVICPGGSGWNSRALTSATFTLTPPDGTLGVLERWFEADICEAMLKPGQKSVSELRQIHKKILDKLRKENKKTEEDFAELPRHPAVEAIGLSVDFDDDEESKTIIVRPKFTEERRYLAPGMLSLHSGKTDLQENNGDVTLTLAPGTIATVKVWSLVPEKYFVAGDYQRMANFASQKEEPVWVGYRAFSVTEHLFECLPDASTMDTETVKALASIQDSLVIATHESETVARLMTKDGFNASWLKGFLVQRHEWHWTGYPLALPKQPMGQNELKQWAEAFAGTSSLRETQNHLLQTNEGQNSQSWRFATSDKPAILCRLQHPRFHGARFFASVMRPVIRFRDWLETQKLKTLEDIVVAQGSVVAARVDWSDPSLRLAPPVVQAAIPLARTVAVQGGEIRTSANGAMICLSESLCRTDSLALYGGVGETFEVDLDASRSVGADNIAIDEIGPNPIFHAGPDGISLPYASWFSKLGQPVLGKRNMNWGIEADRPFGLTYDTDSNAKVAQTAIIVRPTGNDAFAYWIMAKVRIRRMLDPHEHWTRSDELPSDAGGLNWLLGRRKEGDDQVPFDFVIEVPAGEKFTLALHPEQGYEVKEQGSKGALRRLLCSWHKGLWQNKGTMSWGLQVIDQLLTSERWLTVARYTPGQTRLETTDLPIKSVLPLPLRKAANCTARRLLLSDYGEANWLTFIGMPYRHLAIANEQFRMSVSADNVITLTRSSVVDESEIISRDLLIASNKPGESGRGTFHLLLVFSPINDVAAPQSPPQLGQLAGVYFPQPGVATDAEPYPALNFNAYMQGSGMPSGSVGYLYRFQYTEALPKNWETLLPQLFPDGAGNEAKVRWLPELLGPITMNDLPVHNQWSGDKIEIKSTKGGKNSLSIDINRGWRWKTGSKPTWAGDLDGGLCTVMDGDELALVGSGGRLIATLNTWSTTAGTLTAYDDEGNAGGDVLTWRMLKTRRDGNNQDP